jgi:hypothetical protein
MGYACSNIPTNLTMESRNMKKFSTNFLYLIPLLFLLMACGGTALPETRPDDFYVRTYAGGGMTPEGYTLVLSAEESEYTAWVNGVDFTVQFQTPAERLDALYQVLREQQFDRIQTYEELVYDRNGASIQVRANQQNYDVSDGGMSFIEEGWQANYETVWQAINDAVPEPAGKPVTIEWHENDTFSGLNITVEAGSLFQGVTEVGLDQYQAKVWLNPAPITLPLQVSFREQPFEYNLDLTQYDGVNIDVAGDEIIFTPLSQ